VCQTCSQDRQLPEPKGMWYGCVIRCRRLPCGFPDRVTLSAPKGDRPIRKMRPSGAAPTSPPEGVLRHMRHQELWRAVGTHYGPTRIYGPTGHAIGGTAQQALRELPTRLSQPGLGTISDDYGPAAFRRSKDLAAAAGARATRMSRLRAGDAAGGRGPERRRATGQMMTMRLQERGRASVREHGTRSAVQVNSTRHVLGIYYSD